MRTPSPTVVVDAAVLISASLGRTAAALSEVKDLRVLVTTQRVVEEARRRIGLGLKRPDLLRLLEELVAEIPVVPIAELEPLLRASETALKDAVTSRNGSTKDAHVLALAWAVRGDIWSGDRDFAGTGIASWSTANLLRALAEPQAG